MSVLALAVVLASGAPSSGYLICSGQDSSSGHPVVYVGEPVHGSDADIPEFRRAFANEVAQRYGVQLLSAITGCATAETRAEAKEGFDYAVEYPTRHGGEPVVVKWSGDRGSDWSSTATHEPSKGRGAPEGQSAVHDVPKVASVSATHRPKKTNAQADADFAAAQELYKRQMAEHQKQVDDYNRALDEVARKKAEQAAAAKDASESHEAQLAAHNEAIRQHELEIAAYEAEVAAARTKVQSDFDKRNGLGNASTDTDANRCITTAETRLNDTFKGNTSASIVNGCGQKVDVRICLMTDGGWNCGVRWGVASQARASFSSFNATGQVFVDAKVTGSAKALASPN